MATERVQRQIDRLLDEVEQAISRFDWGAARSGARAVLALHAENADALAYLAAAENELQALIDGDQPTIAPQLDRQSEAPPLQTVPTSFANGRYTVKRFLGEGGKKKVYLAHDTLLDRDVAFALIKT